MDADDRTPHSDPVNDPDRGSTPAMKRRARVSLTSKIDSDLRFQLKMKALEGDWTQEEIIEQLLVMWVAGRCSPVLTLGQQELQGRDFSNVRRSARHHRAVDSPELE